MSSILPREYLDDTDNFFEARRYLRKPHYFIAFRFLYDWFITKGNKSITGGDIQYKLMIVNHSVLYQLLKSFIILNLIDKHKPPGRRTLYLLKNKPWWLDMKEELKPEYEKFNKKYNGYKKNN